MNKTLKISIGIFIGFLILMVVAVVLVCLSMDQEDWNATEIEKPATIVDPIPVSTITSPASAATSIPTHTQVESKPTSAQSLVDKYMNSVKSEYDKLKFDQSYIRESDGFVLYHGSRWDAGNVNTHSTYPPYGDMTDDENHGFSVYIHSYSTIRSAHNKMTKDNECRIEYSDNRIISETLNYCDRSYKTVGSSHANSNDPDEITGYHANIFILKDKYIGRIFVHGYLDPDECEEVVDYYAPILAAILNNIE